MENAGIKTWMYLKISIHRLCAKTKNNWYIKIMLYICIKLKIMTASKEEIRVLLEDALWTYHKMYGIPFTFNHVAFSEWYAENEGESAVKTINEIKWL